MKKELILLFNVILLQKRTKNIKTFLELARDVIKYKLKRKSKHEIRKNSFLYYLKTNCNKKRTKDIKTFLRIGTRCHQIQIKKEEVNMNERTNFYII